MSTQVALTHSRTVGISRLLTARVALGAMVVSSTIVQLILAAPRASVRYLPDEYLYSQLARSLGQGHGSTVLGESASLPAMLEPLLTAPFWRLSNAETSIQLTQAFNSLAMALAVIPVYLIARELRLSAKLGLLAALVAVVAPTMLYASYVTADSLGYLLALVAIHAAVRACAQPTARAQVWFLATAFLATFTRVQYATLVIAFVVAVIVVERYHPIRAVRRFWLTSVVLGLGTLAGLVVGGALLGRYGAITGFGLSGRTVSWTAKTTILLVAVTGAAVAPGAIAWAVSAIVRPVDRARAAFAAVSVVLIGSLIVAAAMISADTYSDRFLERYLLIAFPLVVIGLFCWFDEGRPAPIVAGAVAALMIIEAARSPISGDLIGQGSADSPSLLALSRLVGILGGPAQASLVAALVVSACAALALAAALSPRIPRLALILPTIICLALLAGGAHAADIRASKRAYASTFAGDAAWIEAAKPGPTLFVQTPGSNPFVAMVTTVWNPSIVRAAPLGTKEIIHLDGLSKTPVVFNRNGELVDGKGALVRGSVLFATGGSTFAFDGRDRTAKDRFFSLVVPHDGLVRVRAFAAGVRSNNTIARDGSLTAYPPGDGTCGVVTLRMTLPTFLPPTVLEFRDGAGGTHRYKVTTGKLTIVKLRSTADSPRTLTFRATKVGDLPNSSGGITLSNSEVVANVATGQISATKESCG